MQAYLVSIFVIINVAFNIKCMNGVGVDEAITIQSNSFGPCGEFMKYEKSIKPVSAECTGKDDQGRDEDACMKFEVESKPSAYMIGCAVDDPVGLAIVNGIDYF